MALKDVLDKTCMKKEELKWKENINGSVGAVDVRFITNSIGIF